MMDVLLPLINAGLAGIGVGMWLARPKAIAVDIQPYAYDYTLDMPVIQPEPWRNHRLAGECGNIPTELAVELFMVEEQEEWTRVNHAAELYDLKEQIAVNGITHPLVVDVCGECLSFRDGHHRLICAADLGIERVPVYFRQTKGVKVRQKPADIALVELARQVDWGLRGPELP